MRPGVNVTVRDSAPPSSIPTDVGTGFMVGVTEAGPSIPTISDLVQNMDEYEAKYAPSGRNYVAGISLYDSAELFFSRGGNRLYVGRVYGDGALVAKIDIPDAAAAVALKAEARNVGEWGNGIDLEIRGHTEDANIAVGSFRILVIRESDSAVLEESYDLADNAAAINWASTSPNIKLLAGVSALDPAPATIDLAAGTNDVVGIDNDAWQRSADSLSVTLGPGILFAPGVTTGAIYNILASSAERDGRVCFLDGPDSADASTLLSAAAGVVDSTLRRSRFSGLFVPWLIVPGVTTNTTRKVPPSGAVAGQFAANMAAGLSANEPAAGDRGRLDNVLDLTQTYSDDDRRALNLGGVNVIKDVSGVIKVYGWRTVVDRINDPRWIDLGNSILHRQIVALAGEVGERFIFRQIDGQGRLISEFGGALIGEVCIPLFLSGSLYGATPEEAYKVDVGPSVNTVATIADNQLRAVISVKMSPFGEEVNIEIVKYLVTEAIPA